MLCHNWKIEALAPGLAAVLVTLLAAACDTGSADHDFRSGDRPEYDKLVSATDIADVLERGGAVLDVRLLEDYEANPALIPRAQYRNPERMKAWAGEFAEKEAPVVVYCVRGKWVSQKVAHYLDSQGIEAYVLDGGIEAWQASEKQSPDEARPTTAGLASPNDRGVAFNHMHVVVAELGPHAALWPELFDAVMVEKAGYTAARLPGALIFFREAEPTSASAATIVDHFGLEVRDLSALLARWRASGHEVEADETGTHEKHTVFITIPDGIKLALSENPDLAESARMGHVHFDTSLPADLAGWYARLFGAVVRSSGSAEPVAEVPGALLRFSGSPVDKLPTEGTAIDHIGFEIENWDAFIETLEADDIEFEFGPVYVESLDIRVAFFSDPAGALVEISHGLDNF